MLGLAIIGEVGKAAGPRVKPGATGWGRGSYSPSVFKSGLTGHNNIADIEVSRDDGRVGGKRVRIFSDFKVFEKPPKLSPALFRWIAWRWLFLGFALVIFTAVVAATHFIGGEPIYYTNDNRNLTDTEVWQGALLFLVGGGIFAALGLCGVLFIPKD